MHGRGGVRPAWRWRYSSRVQALVMDAFFMCGGVRHSWRSRVEAYVMHGGGGSRQEGRRWLWMEAFVMRGGVSHARMRASCLHSFDMHGGVRHA